MSRTTTTSTHRAKKDLYQHLVREMKADPAVTEATMMGLPCLRVNGAFFAALDRTTSNLIVKLPVDRVTDLIATGIGTAFAPNHRPFREWVAVTRLDQSTWADLMREAKAFVGTSDRRKPGRE
jgi:hypothetical protein